MSRNRKNKTGWDKEEFLECYGDFLTNETIQRWFSKPPPRTVRNSMPNSIPTYVPTPLWKLPKIPIPHYEPTPLDPPNTHTDTIYDDAMFNQLLDPPNTPTETIYDDAMFNQLLDPPNTPTETIYDDTMFDQLLDPPTTPAERIYDEDTTQNSLTTNDKLLEDLLASSEDEETLKLKVRIVDKIVEKIVESTEDEPFLTKNNAGDYVTKNVKDWWDMKTFAELLQNFGTWGNMEKVLRSEKWFVENFLHNRLDWSVKSVKVKGPPTLTKNSTYLCGYRQLRFFRTILKHK